jgi:hypothetical protein
MNDVLYLGTHGAPTERMICDSEAINISLLRSKGALTVLNSSDLLTHGLGITLYELLFSDRFFEIVSLLVYTRLPYRWSPCFELYESKK